MRLRRRRRRVCIQLSPPCPRTGEAKLLTTDTRPSEWRWRSLEASPLGAGVRSSRPPPPPRTRVGARGALGHVEALSAHHRLIPGELRTPALCCSQQQGGRGTSTGRCCTVEWAPSTCQAA
jgi:hypothetical protein